MVGGRTRDVRRRRRTASAAEERHRRVVVAPISRRNLVRGPVIVGALASLVGSAYVGSIAAPAITGIVFHTSVTDSGVHLIALIMIGVSILAVTLSFLDRQLRSPGRPTSQRLESK